VLVFHRPLSNNHRPPEFRHDNCKAIELLHHSSVAVG
jgi:hypothetical protein